MAAARFREDIINDEFIVRVLKHHRVGKDVELLEFSASAGTTKGDNYMGDLVSPMAFGCFQMVPPIQDSMFLACSRLKYFIFLQNLKTSYF